MKKISFIFPFLMSFALASCSSDEPELSVEETGTTPATTERGYIAVNIVQPKAESKPNAAPSRAASEGFEYGTDAENKATTGTFFIFDANGNKIGDTQEVKLSGKGEGTAPETERIYNTVLVIEGETTEPTTSKYIACVLNAPADVASATTLDALAAKIGDYSASTDGAFIMCNSVHSAKAEHNTQIATLIDGTKIKSSASEALNSPVEICVERVVARVDAQAKEGGIENTGGSVEVDGTTKSLIIKITGATIANVANHSYLFKNVEGMAAGTTAYWDASNMRSYWETVPALGAADNQLAFTNKNYADIATTGFDINTYTLKQYIQPNTSDRKTSIMVTAELYEQGATAPISDLVYMQGRYTGDANAKKVVATHLASKNYYKKDAAGNVAMLEATDFEWKNSNDFTGADKTDLSAWLKSFEVVAQIKSEVTALYKNDGTAADKTVAEVNSYLRTKQAKQCRARVFDQGKCYYFVNIDQSAILGHTAGTDFGVVRNHIYDLSLDKISGIGTPVFDPTDPIIPEKPDPEDPTFYLAASVKVLAWKVAPQSVQFEGQ